MNAAIRSIEDALRFVDADDRDIWLHVAMALQKELGEDGRPSGIRGPRSL